MDTKFVGSIEHREVMLISPMLCPRSSLGVATSDVRRFGQPLSLIARSFETCYHSTISLRQFPASWPELR